MFTDSKGREFYKGFTLEAVRRQADGSMFSSKTICWRAYLGATLVAEFPLKNELKAFLRANPPSALRARIDDPRFIRGKI